MTSLPASVGFSITQMIELGLLDDCLHAIGAHAAARQGAIAKGHLMPTFDIPALKAEMGESVTDKLAAP